MSKKNSQKNAVPYVTVEQLVSEHDQELQFLIVLRDKLLHRDVRNSILLAVFFAHKLKSGPR